MSKEARKHHYDWLIKKGTERTPAHFLAYSTNGDTHEMMQAYADKVKLEHAIEALEKEERIAMDKYQSWLKENKGYVMNGFHIRAMAYKDLKEKYQEQLEQLKTNE